MQYLKTSWKGILTLAGLFLLNGFLWLSATPIFEQPLESTVAQSVGATILLGFTAVFLLSTKNRLVTWLFGGLENVYSTHRWLAMGSLLLIFLHAQTASSIIQYYRGDIPFEAADMGPLARNLFIALIALALLAKYMKYEHWRFIHRLMVIPYLISAYHAFFISSYSLLSLSPLGIWMMLMVLAGTLSSVYMILIYRISAFNHKGRVKRVETIAKGVVEIEVELTTPYPFKTGQFTFIKIEKAPFNGVPHPFTISGAGEGNVYFTIKALGDFTEGLAENLKTGDAFFLSRPYGHMTFEDFESPQVWVAGGIGITPFLSHLRTDYKGDKTIDLYYSVKTKEEAVHLEFLRTLEKEHEAFTLHFSESDKDGFLSVENITLDHHPSVFMCGPVPMAKALKKEFAKTEKHRTLIYEAFSFTGTLAEDLETFLKWFYKRFRKPKKA
ncbi:MAG: ferric reductase-like transmembrane domain-containing protein [Candidatus Izemoplasmataceae bacterium]